MCQQKNAKGDMSFANNLTILWKFITFIILFVLSCVNVRHKLLSE